MKKILVFTIVIVLLLAGCNHTNDVEEEQSTTSTKEAETMTEVPKMQIDKNKKYSAKMETSAGDIELTLFAKDAPKTVNNFVVLSKKGFYDGTIFHRIIPDFMVQRGDPEGNGTGGPGYQFEDEINSIKLTQGKLAMANAGPDTNGSQFFIITAKETAWLDGKHTVFGEASKGMDVVLKISEAETGQNDKPLEDIILKKVTINED